MKISEALTKAVNELGVSEYPADSNNVKYNTWYYGRMVEGREYPWCAVFISFLFKDNQHLVKRTNSCQQMLEWFEARNRVVTDPQPGDIVFFFFFSNGRRTNHVGIVVSVQGKNNLTTIEGNTSLSSNDNGGKVMQRRRTMKNIVAFARPEYEDASSYHPTLKKGSKGNSVAILQTLLNIDVDGDFGPKTKEAVIQFQKAHNLKPDGIVGPKTWEELLK